MKKRKRLLLLTLPLLIMSNTGSVSYTPYIEVSKISEDLKESDLIKDYDKVTFLDFYEYKYGNDDYSLYFYISIPSKYNYISVKELNKIELSFNDSTYYKFSFSLLDKEDSIYKFKIDISDYKDTILSLLDENERSYKISGIELFTNDSNINSIEYKVGGNYIYKGYSKGINGNNESSLVRKVENLDVIDLDVKELMYRTNLEYTYPNSILNEYRSYQINSVYFNVPNYYLSNYGDLVNISCEYYKYRTAPLFIVKTDLYNELKDYIGVKQTKENNIGYDLSSYWYGDYYASTGLTLSRYIPILDYSYEFNNIGKYAGLDNTNTIVYLFDGGSKGDNDIDKETLSSYIYNYDKTYFNGSNYKGLSNDLFILDKSDGYTSINISDTDNLLIDNNSSIDRFLNSFGFNIKNELSLKCIEEIDYSSIDENKLCIDSNDIENFKKDVKAANENDETTFIFRFDTSIYNVGELYKHTYGDVFYGNIDGYVVQENVYFDFDIISLTFKKEGNSYIIPCVSNPIDIIDEIITPDIKDNEWLTKLMNILKFVLGCLIILASLIGINFVFNLLGISLKDIFNFLFIKPIKWIKNKIKGNKKSSGKKKK